MTTSPCRTPDCPNPKQHGRGFRYCADCGPTARAEVKKACNAAWRERHPEHNEPNATRARRLWARFRLTPAAFDSLLTEQEGRCAACRTDDPGPGGWHVDHDHACCPTNRAGATCGRCVRGILCGSCNWTLGYAHDDAARLRRLADYLDARPLAA